MSLLQSIGNACRPTAYLAKPVRMYKFKNTSGVPDEMTEFETVIAESYEEAMRKNPAMGEWFLFSVTK